MLKEQILEELELLGLSPLKHPIFYNCHYGIRFEIGVGDVYNKDMTPRKEYVENALRRAMTIYNNGIKSPAILIWEVYPQSEEDKSNFNILFSKKIIPISPQEEFSLDMNIDNDIENHVMLHLYDDRGLDIVGHDKNTLIPIYQN